jgi:hypothetical protein
LSMTVASSWTILVRLYRPAFFWNQRSPATNANTTANRINASTTIQWL